MARFLLVPRVCECYHLFRRVLGSSLQRHRVPLPRLQLHEQGCPSGKDMYQAAAEGLVCVYGG